jgi:hypothetical protein
MMHAEPALVERLFLNSGATGAMPTPVRPPMQ